MSFTKFKYYSSNSLISLIPASLFRLYAKRKLKAYDENEQSDIQARVKYYNKIIEQFEVGNKGTKVRSFKKTSGTTYYFDLLKVIKGFPSNFAFHYLNGDVRHVPDEPTFVKSRPISDGNGNSVILKLNAIRHFYFVRDKLSFEAKKNMVAWRGVGFQPRRQVVLQKFHDHPMCNIGQTRPLDGNPWEKGFMSIEEQLTYKFLLAIEGNDVATNLKWAMSSNSLVLMSKPTCETWFMEGRLEAGVHYVEVADDYSDLIEKMEYYIAYPEKAESIIKNAHAWVAQFRDQKRERLISLLVAKKYFEKSGQM
ncbi:lipopolysaccharide A protein [Vibrio parahaemolyticus]|uniref:glycosyl transferase family 90 n=1 Tax=Vibrio parahaemolyticus TaxID=670 RepID=UPI001869713F|nr:glycosyl transferase family 90 [Vibrio parahaemolyticus]EGQ8177905.1 lipopolysaccharide A protein [Vibrio parahaemolyticus]EHD6027900.1 lipopolysaccharide A protein [Vibrio parahaemolyticus]EJR0957262.1 lipopolysaccharide A protein [Vibrio parahaemolyticus]EKY4209484.1 lipopolysaccharide A protein [Vibrio parahaemolyticus]EMA9658308.1 lipopolysaccharide A protein [Vibrio parahaemolyticus]